MAFITSNFENISRSSEIVVEVDFNKSDAEFYLELALELACFLKDKNKNSSYTKLQSCLAYAFENCFNECVFPFRDQLDTLPSNCFTTLQ